MILEPWSDCTVFGNPTSVKNLIKYLTIVAARIFLSGMASGNLVEAHMIVSMYWLPVLVRGNGPTISISTWLKGSSKAGIGLNGATGIF